MDRYSKFILTVIAIGIWGLIFKFEFNNTADAGTNAFRTLTLVERNCEIVGTKVKCLPVKWNGLS